MKSCESTVELLIEAGLITQPQIDKAWAAAAKSNGKTDIIQAIVKLGYVKQNKITEILAQQYGLETIDLKEYQIPKDVIARVTGELAREYGIIPVMYHSSTLTVAISDPSDIEILDTLRFRLKCDIEAVVTTKAEIDRLINLHYCSLEVDKFLKPKAGDAEPTKAKLMDYPGKTSLASKPHPYALGCCDLGTKCVPYEPDAEPMVKIKWRRLEDYEVLRAGDIWASEDPNTPERQSGGGYNLRMQAAIPGGLPVSGTGAHWRPVGVVLDAQAPQLLICKAAATIQSYECINPCAMSTCPAKQPHDKDACSNNLCCRDAACKPKQAKPAVLPKLLNVLDYQTPELQTLCLTVNDLTRWLEAQKTEAKLEKSKS